MKNTYYYHYCKEDGKTEMLITQGTVDYMQAGSAGNKKGIYFGGKGVSK